MDEEIEEMFVCDCYPEHCNNPKDHGECWCSPEVLVFDEGRIFIHKEEL